MKKFIWLGAGLALTLAGCAEMQTAPATPAKTAAAPAPSGSALDDTIANAEKEIAAAAKMNGVWKNTEDFLQEAKKLRAEGKTDAALKMAQKALKEAQLAQKQARAEADAKPHFAQ